MAAKAPHVRWAGWLQIVLRINGCTPMIMFDRVSEASRAIDDFKRECLTG